MTLFYTLSIYLILIPVVFGFLSTFLADNRGKNRKWYIWAMASLWPATIVVITVNIVVFGIIVGMVKIYDGIFWVTRKLVELGEELGN